MSSFIYVCIFRLKPKWEGYSEGYCCKVGMTTQKPIKRIEALKHHESLGTGAIPRDKELLFWGYWYSYGVPKLAKKITKWRRGWGARPFSDLELKENFVLDLLKKQKHKPLAREWFFSENLASLKNTVYLIDTSIKSKLHIQK